MKIYLELSVSADEVERELLIPRLAGLGCIGFLETESDLFCYFEKEKITSEEFESIQTQMRVLLDDIPKCRRIIHREFEDKNWNEEWEKSLCPVVVGSKLVVEPSYSLYENHDHRIAIRIDPKMSFGTGHHETTRLTLTLLEKYVYTGCSMLDIGTGTGILSIAGVKLGAGSAVGTEIDEWSIINADENITANGVQDKIVVRKGDTANYQTGSFNLITANLTLNTNIALLGEFFRLLSPSGILLISGFFNADEEIVVHKLEDSGFTTLEITRENEWTAIAARKSS